MFKFIKNYFNFRRQRAALRSFFEPDKNFLNQARREFLAKLPQGQELPMPVGFLSRHLRPALKFGLAGVMGLAVLGSGLTVYADKQNVGYNHPLYRFKRLGENVRLMLTNSSLAPALYDELAGRRLEEYKQVSAQVSASKETGAASTVKAAAMKLDNDFHQEVDVIMTQINDKKIEGVAASSLCASVAKKMAENDEDGLEELKEKQIAAWKKVEAGCGHDSGRKRELDGE